MDLPWFYKVLDCFWNRYELHTETPMTVTNQCKVIRAKNILLA